MPCDDLAGDGSVIICSRSRPTYCQTPGHESRRSVALCDYPAPHRKSKTCDRRMCSGCRRPVPGQPGKDYCPPHDETRKAQALKDLP